MGRAVILFLGVTLAGCAGASADHARHDSRPSVTIECLAPQNGPYARCTLISVDPDTSEMRLSAERMVEAIPTSGARPPSEDLINARTVRFVARLNPETPGDATGDGLDASR